MSSPFYNLEEAEFVSFSFEAAALFVIRRSRNCLKVTCREMSYYHLLVHVYGMNFVRNHMLCPNEWLLSRRIIFFMCINIDIRVKVRVKNIFIYFGIVVDGIAEILYINNINLTPLYRFSVSLALGYSFDTCEMANAVRERNKQQKCVVWFLS